MNVSGFLPQLRSPAKNLKPGPDMRLEDFDYQLPEERIAQHPCLKRDHARMMVVNRTTGDIVHDVFLNLPDYLKKEDTLVVNDSKVIPARLIGKKETGGLIEILLLSNKFDGISNGSTWEALLRPARRVRPGTRIFFDVECEAVIVSRTSDKKWLITFSPRTDFNRFLSQFGRAPLPPYIKRKQDDPERSIDIESYQTVYARMPGSVAAPTAGLHFSHHVLTALREKGIVTAPVTLHVGYGTFLPIETDHVEEHRMEEEYYEISEDAAVRINNARHVIAVGTTSTRVIESAADEKGRVMPLSFRTDLFIYPGYRFKRVNSLLTNFHLPRSSLFLLVCAFAGKDLIQRAYRQAIDHRYRFYSYGDCMLIL
jgi:S-adenosylmethionine:tRNA ribosyltransferase-isomerase